MQEEITMSSFSIFLRSGFHFFNSFDLEFCIFSFCLNLRISNLASWLGDGKLAVDVGCRLSGSGLNGQRHPECICIQKAMLCKDKSRAASFYSCETHWNEFVSWNNGILDSRKALPPLTAHLHAQFTIHALLLASEIYCKELF